MEAIDRIIELIKQARILHAEITDLVKRYQALAPIFAELKEKVEYINNNYEYAKYTIVLETLDAMLAPIYEKADAISLGKEANM